MTVDPDRARRMPRPDQVGRCPRCGAGVVFVRDDEGWDAPVDPTAVQRRWVAWLVLSGALPRAPRFARHPFGVARAHACVMVEKSNREANHGRERECDGK